MHSVFPATLYRFQVHRESQLFDKSLGKDDWDPEDSVEVSADGLVYPKITVDGMLQRTFYPELLLRSYISLERGSVYAKYTFHAGSDPRVL